MRVRKKLAVVLIMVTLVGMLCSSFPMILFKQLSPVISGEAAVHRWDYHVREAGYGRVAIAVVGLIILAIPFRRGQRWAWWSLTFTFVSYVVPAFVLPVLVPFPGWHIFSDWMGDPGLARNVFSNLLFPFLMGLGLCLSLPDFLRGETGGQSTKL